MKTFLLAAAALTGIAHAHPVERSDSNCSTDHIAVPNVLGAKVLDFTATEFTNHNVSVDQGVPDPYSVALSYCGVNM